MMARERAAQRGRLGLALGLGLSLSACKTSDRAPNHPITDIYDRNTSKIELVPLIVTDPARADKVQSIYKRIASISETLMKERARRLSAIGQLLEEDRVSEDEVKEQVSGMRAESQKVYDEYVALQLELRALLNADEFAKLDKVR